MFTKMKKTNIQKGIFILEFLIGKIKFFEQEIPTKFNPKKKKC